jgi:hypothetical protein
MLLVSFILIISESGSAQTPASKTSDIAQLITAIASVLWPLVALTALFIFRQEIRSLFGRLRRGKMFGQEIELETPVQSPSPKAESITVSSSQGIQVGANGFLTEESIKKVVEDYGIAEANKVDKLLQIFATSKQRTWLASTQNHLFCLLDDADSRKSGRLIQWVISKSEAEPIEARRKSQTLGSVLIDDRGRWLYSANLFPNTDDFENRVRELIKPTTQPNNPFNRSAG